MTKAEKRKLTKLFLEQYNALERTNCSMTEWVALKLGVSLTEASKLVRDAEAQ